MGKKVYVMSATAGSQGAFKERSVGGAPNAVGHRVTRWKDRGHRGATGPGGGTGAMRLREVHPSLMAEGLMTGSWSAWVSQMLLK